MREIRIEPEVRVIDARQIFGWALLAWVPVALILVGWLWVTP